MRKITVLSMITLDGVLQAPGGPEKSDWKNTIFLKSPADIEKLKNSEGADIQVWGTW